LLGFGALAVEDIAPSIQRFYRSVAQYGVSSFSSAND
jgi:hypothetical protein